MAYTKKQKAEWYFLTKKFKCDKITKELIIDFWLMTNRYGFGLNILIEGDPRTGKSRLAKTLAELLDSSFTHETMRQRVHWKTSQAINGIRHSKKGQAHIFEELGADANSREFFNVGNRNLSKVMQIKNYKNSILIATVPRKKMVDSQVREMFNVHITIDRFGSNPPTAKIYLPRYYTTMGKTLPTSPKILINEERQIYKLKKIKLLIQPSPQILKEYLRIEQEHKGNLMDKYEDEARQDEGDEDDDVTNYDELEAIADIIFEDIKEHKNTSKYLNTRNNVDLFKVSVKHQIGEKRAKRVRAFVEMKLQEYHNQIQTTNPTQTQEQTTDPSEQQHPPDTDTHTP